MRSFGAVVVCLALAGCQAKKSASLHIDASLEPLVPADTVAVAGADVDAIRGTPVYQRLVTRFAGEQMERVKAASKVLFCWDGKQGLLLSRGKFAKADVEIGPPFEYKGYRLFGDEHGGAFFLNDSTVVAGPTGALRSMIDSKGGRGLPPALADLLRTLPASDQIYAALIGGLGGMSLPENALEALRSADRGVIGIDLGDGINAIARIDSKNERDAKFIHDMLRGMIGFARLRAPENQPELLKLYDAIEVTQQQTQTEVKAEIPAGQVDRLLSLLPKR